MIYFKSLYKGLSLAVVCILFSSLSIAQNSGRSQSFNPAFHHEVPDDAYKPSPANEHGRSPAYHSRGSSFFTVQVNVDEDGLNILGDAANEPSIAVDPVNPDKMVIGWRQFDNVNNNFRQAGYAYTTDGGQTWTFPGVIEPGVFRSDPVLSYDTAGNIYYNSLTVSDDFNDFWCNVFIMNEDVTEWDGGTYAQGGDKQWMEIDRTDGIGSGNIYAFWTSNYSICYPGFFTRSTDGGASYEDCVTITGDPQWGTLTVGSEGELYIGGYSWGGFVFSKSLTAQDPGSMVIWENYKTVNLNGDIASGEGPNPGGLLGQTWIGVDNSDGPYSGNIYMLCSVDPYGSDPLDVMIARSTDGGDTWSNPVRVNDDLSNSNWQWFGTMSVAPDGRIDVVWLDTRDADPGSYNSSLYYAYSIDGGETFSENERVSDSFDPHVGWPDQNKMGDYFHMISDLDGANLAWANTLNGEQDVYYTHIDPWFVGVGEHGISQKVEVVAYPNPSAGNVTIKYKLAESGKVNIVIYDVYGKPVKELFAGSQPAGQDFLRFDGTELPAGFYTCRVQAGAYSATAKITIVK